MSELAKNASPFLAIAHHDAAGSLYWRARDLQALLGYETWRGFADSIERAALACKNSGYNDMDHFVPTSKMIRVGKGGERDVLDYRLTKYACHLIAMNGDPKKLEIANAQTYFSLQVHRAEMAQEKALATEDDPLLAQLAITAQMRREQLALSAQVAQQGQAIADVRAELAQEAIKGAQVSTIYKLGQQLGKLMGGTKAHYNQAWRLFKDRFDLASYRDLPRCQFDEGVRFLTLQVDSYAGRPAPLLGE